MTKISHDSETAAHGQQVITACALIHHDFDGVTKVFLPRRADIKKFLPGVYEIPGGHIDYGENIAEDPEIQALYRAFALLRGGSLNLG